MLSPRDIFSIHSDSYAKYRPHYPEELFDFIIARVEKKQMALDCGTGNGQAAQVLAQHFKKVYAIDISSSQITNAVKKENIEYIISRSEQTPFPDNTFDLITVAMAVHWFHFDTFYTEMRRIAINNCIIACWGYNLLKTNRTEFNKMLKEFYFVTLQGCWDKERNYVEKDYKIIPFPFDEIQNPGFEHHVEWNLFQMEGYLNTWSAILNYIKKSGSNPVPAFINSVRLKFGDNVVFKVVFPLFMRIGRISKSIDLQA